MSSLVTQPTPDNVPGSIMPTARPSRPRDTFASRLAAKGRLWLVLALLLLPTIGSTLLFTYYPQFSAVWYSFFDWDGQQNLEFTGLKNYVEAFTRDRVFWTSFQLTLMLLLANMVKMWPSIITAVVMHRLRSERWQYIYRVLFVIPMIIPGLVGLLIWKSFYDPGTGVVNKLLNATGLMSVLNFLDSAWPNVVTHMLPVRLWSADMLFGSIWGMALVGIVLRSAVNGFKSTTRAVVWWCIVNFIGVMIWYAAENQFWYFMLWVNLASTIIIFGKWSKKTLRVFKWTSWTLLIAAALFLVMTMVWTKSTGQFAEGQPVWLGNPSLVIPAIMFWGFPWVGTVGVLIYLAGLQAIDTSIYEAGEIDGVSSFGKLWYIELPLILTQVRINLVFMTIGTLTDYGLLLLLLGPEGGPQSVGMVPGLYAYRQAFISSRYGYACALGMVMFLIILAITILYQKYVKVDK